MLVETYCKCDKDMATMDAEDFIRTDVDTVTVLACDDDTKQQPECSEVEDLQNRYRLLSFQ